MNYFVMYEQIKRMKKELPIDSIWEFAATNDKLRVTGHQVIHSSVIDTDLFLHYQLISSNGAIGPTHTCMASSLIYSPWKMIA